MERLSVIEYTNHVLGPDVLVQKSKFQSDRFHQTFVEAGTLKYTRYLLQRAGKFLKLNFIHREDCKLFRVLINKLLELNEVLIHLFVAISLRITAILIQ